MLAQAFTLTEPSAGAAASAAPPRSPPRKAAQPSTSTVKVRPAAPTMNWRRVMPLCNVFVVVMALSLPHGALDRAHDARIGAAAADVGAHLVLDLRARRARVRREQRRGAHELARLAVAALRHALGEPRALQRVHPIGRETLDRRDRFALYARHRHEARKHPFAVDMHHAGAALARAAAEFGAGELQFLAQHPQEAGAFRRSDADRLAVDGEIDRHVGSFVLDSGWAQRGGFENRFSCDDMLLPTQNRGQCCGATSHSSAAREHAAAPRQGAALPRARLAAGEILAPGLPVVLLPALVDAVVVVVRDVDVHEVDAPALALGREADDQRRIDVALAKGSRAPGLYDQPARDGLQHAALQRAAESAEFRSGPGADDDFPAGDRTVRSRVEVHRVQSLGSSGQGDRL